MKTYKETELKNGIKIVAMPVPGLRSFTVEVFVKIGSKYEKPDEFGMSHFLEHMAFKGTQKRPKASDINNEIDAKGASYNAGTNQEMTSYYITTVKENISWALELLSDILFNSLYDTKEIIKERNVISEEIRMYQDNPMMGLSGEFLQFLYKGSNIGCWDIAGTVKNVMSIDREKLLNFRNHYFNPKNIIVVMAGDVDETSINIAKSFFENYQNKEAIDLPQVQIVINNEKRELKQKQIEQGHFCIGVPALSIDDPRKYAMRLLDIVLSGNSSSRLYTKIREEKALAYYVFSISENFKECGLIGVQSGVNLNKLSEAEDIVVNEFLNIGENLRQKEIDLAKEYLNGRTKLALDRTDYWASFIGEKMLLENELIMPDKELSRYNSVKIEEVKNLAQELFEKEAIRSLIVSR